MYTKSACSPAAATPARVVCACCAAGLYMGGGAFVSVPNVLVSGLSKPYYPAPSGEAGMQARTCAAAMLALTPLPT